MNDFNLANLAPSGARYLGENVTKNDVRRNLMRQIKNCLSQKSIGLACLDTVFCNASMLRAEAVVPKLDNQELDSIFNTEVSGCTPERVNAFIEGLGHAYTGGFQLEPAQKRFAK